MSDLLGGSGFCSLSYLWQTSNGLGFYLDTVCEANFSGSMYYCALTCGSLCWKVVQLSGDSLLEVLVAVLVIVLVNCVYFRSTFHSEVSC